MLKHTKKIERIYEDIQRKLYYMIPEKWEELYLYASVIDKKDRYHHRRAVFLLCSKRNFKKKTG